jgi:MFS family permease
VIATTTTDQDRRKLLAVLLSVTFVMNMLARGVTETFAVFLLPVQQGLGVSRAEITLTYSVFMLSYGLSAPLAGQLIDRLGARAAYGFGLTSLGCGYMLAGSAGTLPQYLLGAGFLGGLGSASLGMIAASALLSRWFTGRMGAIISVPYAAIGAGMLLFPPLTQLALSVTDWRTAYHLLGGLVLIVLPILMFARLGRLTAGSPEWRALRSQTVQSASSGWTVSSAARTSAFWDCSSPIWQHRWRPTQCFRIRSPT